jgi:hypothetical protein
MQNSLTNYYRRVHRFATIQVKHPDHRTHTCLMHGEISQVNTNYQYRQLTSTLHSNFITSVSLLSTATIMPRILWIRTTDVVKQHLKERYTLHNSTLFIQVIYWDQKKWTIPAGKQCKEEQWTQMSAYSTVYLYTVRMSFTLQGQITLWYSMTRCLTVLL